MLIVIWKNFRLQSAYGSVVISVYALNSGIKDGNKITMFS